MGCAQHVCCGWKCGCNWKNDWFRKVLKRRMLLVRNVALGCMTPRAKAENSRCIERSMLSLSLFVSILPDADESLHQIVKERSPRQVRVDSSEHKFAAPRKGQRKARGKSDFKSWLCVLPGVAFLRLLLILSVASVSLLPRLCLVCAFSLSFSFRAMT